MKRSRDYLYEPIKDIAVRMGILLSGGDIHPMMCTCDPHIDQTHRRDCPVLRFDQAGQYVNEVVIDLVSNQDPPQGVLTDRERWQLECVYHMTTSEKYSRLLLLCGKVAKALPQVAGYLSDNDRDAVGEILSLVMKGGVNSG